VVLAGGSWSKDTPEVKALAAAARRHQKEVGLALGLTVKAKDSDTALVGALLQHFGITTALVKKTATSRYYGAERGQLALVKITADRLQQKGSGLVAPGAVEVNQTARGATTSAAALEPAQPSLPLDSPDIAPVTDCFQATPHDFVTTWPGPQQQPHLTAGQGSP
jgi:hypothetical protein